MERWLTVRDICAALAVHEQTVRGWLKSGELEGVLLSDKTGWRVRPEAFAAFLAARAKRNNRPAGKAQAA